MKLRLGTKLGITYLILIIMSMAIFGYFVMDFLEENLVNEKKNALYTSANILANSAAPYLRNGGQDKRLDYFTVEHAERYGCRFLVIDKQYKVVADSAEEFKGRILRHEEITNALNGENSAQTLFEDEFGWVLYLAVPVTSGKQVIGAVFLSADVNQLASQLEESRNNLVFFSMVSGLSVFLISLLLGKVMTRPIEKLIFAARRISAGEYGIQVQSRVNDELGELTKVFNEMSQKIKTEDEIRKQFIADASHELKSPVAAIKALLDSWPVKGENTREAADELINDLKFEADRLEKLVDDLLVLSRLEGNRKQLTIEETSVGELVEAVKRAMIPLARRNNVTIKAIHGGNIYWRLDGEKMFRALLNLVDNGVKYSPENGEVKLGFEENGGILEFVISNSGDGIPKEEIPHIFNRFYRIDKARSRKTGGWGLGLPIVKEIVELHNGSIEINSIPGKTTTVKIKLPYLTDS